MQNLVKHFDIFIVIWIYWVLNLFTKKSGFNYRHLEKSAVRYVFWGLLSWRFLNSVFLKHLLYLLLQDVYFWPLNPTQKSCLFMFILLFSVAEISLKTSFLIVPVLWYIYLYFITSWAFIQQMVFICPICTLSVFLSVNLCYWK